MNAIDLYSGIGGWTLGLKLAGVDVLASYEWWDKAINTHNQNFGTTHSCTDVRQIDVKSLPKDIDFVVGSPPCTQFSFSNRGGSGNLNEGMKDVWKFLEVVDHIRPKYWIFENVPRLANIVRQELENGDALDKFAHLIKVVTVVDMSEYGVPQKRRRALVGDFPLELLESYRTVCVERTLGDVLDTCRKKDVHDFLYGFSLPRNQVTELEAEPCLDEEEARMNREAKSYHPVYNLMSFPDRLDRPSRTITATCTRVSRESIVVPDGENDDCVRRLNPRERAMLQGFPINFQFYGGSYSNKLKMIGNAIPPYFTYFLAQALQEVERDDLMLPEVLSGKPLETPEQLPKVTRPDVNGRRFPVKRKFRAALPGLRFGSGVRFELTNSFSPDTQWAVDFYHGPSKAYKKVKLNEELLRSIADTPIYDTINKLFEYETEALAEILTQTSAEELQASWTRRSDGLGPFAVVDLLGNVSEKITKHVRKADSIKIERLVLKAIYGYENPAGNGTRKIALNSHAILAGLLVGAWFNTQNFSRS